MLACMSDRALLTLYSAEDLGSPLTPATITSRTALLAELATIREQGYAVNHGESASGLVAVGAAIRGSDQVPVAALTDGGPAHPGRPRQGAGDRAGAAGGRARDRGAPVEARQRAPVRRPQAQVAKPIALPVPASER